MLTELPPGSAALVAASARMPAVSAGVEDLSNTLLKHANGNPTLY
jgi:hypothetical protein